jgi:hypothetical protein
MGSACAAPCAHTSQVDVVPKMVLRCAREKEGIYPLSPRLQQLSDSRVCSARARRIACDDEDGE